MYNKFANFESLENYFNNLREVPNKTISNCYNEKDKIINSHLLLRIRNIKLSHKILSISFPLLISFFFKYIGLVIGLVFTLLLAYLFFRSKKDLETIILNSNEKWGIIQETIENSQKELSLIYDQYIEEKEYFFINFHTYPKDWNDRRNKVLKRDNHSCQNCGYPDGFKRRSRELHIHHIKSLALGGTNSLENLITLCHICHKQVGHKHNLVRKNRTIKNK